MSRVTEEQTNKFTYVDPVFLGNTKHVVEKKIDVKRPAGAVQRLLQKLENNDEREIINNLKEVFLFHFIIFFSRERLHGFLHRFILICDITF